MKAARTVVMIAVLLSFGGCDSCENQTIDRLAREKGELQSEIADLKSKQAILEQQESKLKEHLESLRTGSESSVRNLKQELAECQAELVGASSRGPKPPSLGVRLMIIALNGLTHVLVLVGLAILVYFLGNVVMAPFSDIERSLRAVAVVTGFLVYFGARAGGMSVPLLLSEAFNNLSLLSTGLIGVVFPSTVGAITAWQFKRAIQANKEGNVGTRVILLISTFIVVLFTECYIDSQQVASGAPLHMHLIPNVAFSVGMALYFILFWEPEKWRSITPNPAAPADQ